jgi:hypothetical protein
MSRHSSIVMLLLPVFQKSGKARCQTLSVKQPTYPGPVASAGLVGGAGWRAGTEGPADGIATVVSDHGLANGLTPMLTSI